MKKDSRFILLVIGVVFAIPSYSQLLIKKDSLTTLGYKVNLDGIALKRLGLILRGYSGLYWQRNIKPDNSLYEYFQLDASSDVPSIAGIRNKIVFYNSMDSKHEAVVVKSLYVNSNSFRSTLNSHSPLKDLRIAVKENLRIDSLYSSLMGREADTLKLVEYSRMCERRADCLPLMIAAIKYLLGESLENYSKYQDLVGKYPEVDAKNKFPSLLVKLGSPIKTEIGIPCPAESSFAIIATVDNKIVASTKLCDMGNGLCNIETTFLNPGLYRLAIVADGQIQSVKNVVIYNNNEL